MSENLSFQFVESKALLELLELCNPNISRVMVKADTITSDSLKMFYGTREKLKAYFSGLSCKLNLSLDLWSSPNGISILGITCHWVDNYEMKELLLDASQLNGRHTGKNIAHHVLRALKQFGIENKLFCITADNASNNYTMGVELSRYLPHFNPDKHLLGCVGHVVNLAAQAGLKALGSESEQLLEYEGVEAETVPAENKCDSTDSSGNCSCKI